MLVTSCKKEETTPVNEAKVLVEYLESANSPLMKDYVNTDMPAIITASDLNILRLANQAYIIDIRSATDFNTGHIPGAHNVATTDLFTHLESADLTGIEKIAVVCYSGQTAQWATTLLRLQGYGNVYSLKFGMCSWNADFATAWNNGIGNSGAASFNTTANAKNAEGDLPELNTGKEDAQDILDARIAAVLTEGFNAAKITNTTVLANPGDYYIINYWPENHYNIGHIPGAIQYTPKETIKLAADLKTLPTDKTIVVYCYTGQTSAALTSYLRVLGYDAKSLLYGTNGMIYDIMVTNSLSVWVDPEADYPVE
jgi:rhodanese-related sulfurtransferase